MNKILAIEIFIENTKNVETKFIAIKNYPIKNSMLRFGIQKLNNSNFKKKKNLMFHFDLTMALKSKF